MTYMYMYYYNDHTIIASMASNNVVFCFVLCRKSVLKSESYDASLPVQYRRIEKYEVISVPGTDKMGRPVIVFSACRLPPSYQISHDVLFE